MKRFFKAATSAALIASMVCAPSAYVVSAAETAAFEVCIADQVIKTGTNKASIPVSFSKDVSFKSIEMEFDCAGYGEVSKSKCAIKGITGSLPADSGVKVAVDGNKVILTSADGYTIKKGNSIVDIAFEITELFKDGNGNEVWPLNVPAKINLSNFKMISSNGSEIELSKEALFRATGNVQVAPAATNGLEVSLDSAIGTGDEIMIPLRLKGSAHIFITEIKVSDFAEIMDFKAESVFAKNTKVFEKSDDSQGARCLRLEWSNDGMSDKVFSDEVVGYVVVKLKDSDAGLSKAMVTFSNIDIATSNMVSAYPSVVKNAMAVKGVKGDINLDGVVDSRDATYTITSYLESRGGNPDYMKNEFAGDKSYADMVDAFTAEKLAEEALKLGDVNEDGLNNTADASFQIQYYLESRAGGTTWDSVLGK